MKFLPLIVLSALLFTGCSLIPKNVEFFQDKVHKFPEPSTQQAEYQRRAALLAKQKAAVTVEAAISEGSSTNVIAPAQETAKLADVVSLSLGPPVTPSTNTDTAVENLRSAIAKLDKKIEAFKRENDENAGKKIEGTGFLQVPYFVYVGLIALVIVVGWHLAKLALTAASMANPGAAVGLAGMNVAGSLAAKGFHQVVQGGEAFKNWVGTRFENPEIKQEILDKFTTFHKEAQDQDVKTLVDRLKD